MTDKHETLREAADRLNSARRAFGLVEDGLRLLRRSREAFINSLRNTGLTYAQAQVKYDNCLDEQQQLHQQAIHELQYAERLHRQLLAELEQTA